MRLFGLGRQKVPEREAANLFILTTFKGVEEAWPQVKKMLSLDGLIGDTAFLDNKWTQFEYAVAVLASESRAIPNLLRTDVAERIDSYIRSSLTASERVGEAATNAYNAYVDAYNRDRTNMNPGDAVLTAFCMRCDVPRSASGPFFGSILLGALTATGGGWWKAFLADSILVP